MDIRIRIVSTNCRIPGEMAKSTLAWFPNFDLFFALGPTGARVSVPQGWALSVALREARVRVATYHQDAARARHELVLAVARATVAEAVGCFCRSEAHLKTGRPGCEEYALRLWRAGQKAQRLAMAELLRIP